MITIILSSDAVNMRNVRHTPFTLQTGSTFLPEQPVGFFSFFQDQDHQSKGVFKPALFSLVDSDAFSAPWYDSFRQI